ncbi:hypothetical protein OC844_004016 [Tilletia horrida]|nr:hypothetical protein OC844_004016 [Tilletia horrida]
MSSQVSTAIQAGAPVPPKLTHVRVKRVVVTSCDSCRLRKLKCNAKELPPGSTCGSCAKHDWQCTFEDSKESQNRPPRRMRHKIHRKPSQDIEFPLHFMAATQGPPVATVASQPFFFTPQAAPSGVGGQVFAPAGPSTTIAAPIHPSSSTFDISPYAPKYAALASSAMFPAFGSSATQLGGADVANPLLAELALPHSLTDPVTGFIRVAGTHQVAELLLTRLFTDSTSYASILPRRQTFQRFFAASPAPLPDYLMQTILAAAAFLPTTHEPELLAWRPHAWSVAVKAVQTRLRSRIPADVSLIQALLLLGNGWIGDPEDSERAVIFEMALRLAFSIGLDSTTAAGPESAERSLRIILFWNMYIVDRVLLIATGRPVILVRSTHDLPLPSVQDAHLIALSVRDDLSTQSDEHIWIQRQLHAFISLANILEDTHSLLQELRDSAPAQTLHDILRRIFPVEIALERWCKDNKLLLRETAAAHGPLCQNLTESMVAQLHMCQLQLYQVAIRFEIEHARSLPILFDPANSKSLTACVESAWYLVQQPLVNHDPAAALQAILPGSKPVTHFNVSNYAVLRAAQFLRLLSCTWAEWNAGRGLEEYTPRNAVEFAAAAQAPWADANVLQRQQEISARQQNFVQPHHSLPPEWKHSPKPNMVALPALEPFGTTGPSLFAASVPAGMQAGTQAAPNEIEEGETPSPSISSSATMVGSPEQQRRASIALGVVAEQRDWPAVPNKPVTPPPSGLARGPGRKAAPKPLNLSASKEAGSGSSTKPAAKRKREVAFLGTETEGEGEGEGSEQVSKLAKVDVSTSHTGLHPEGYGLSHDVVPPRTARLDTAMLESFAFPLTPARFLFDASEIDLSSWYWEPHADERSKTAGKAGAVPAPSQTQQQPIQPDSGSGNGQLLPQEMTSQAGREESGELAGTSVTQPSITVSPPAQQQQQQPQTSQQPTQPGLSAAGFLAHDTLAPSSMPFTPSLGNFGATAAMMTPLRADYMTSIQLNLGSAPLLDPSMPLQAPAQPLQQLPSPSQALASFKDGLDLSAFGLKGLDGLDPLQGIFSGLSASDFAGLSAMDASCPSFPSPSSSSARNSISGGSGAATGASGGTSAAPVSWQDLFA